MVCRRCKFLLGLLLLFLIIGGFYMIEFWEAINWEIATAVSTIVAAFAAAFSAVILRKQHERDINWRKQERTYNLSITKSGLINTATENIKRDLPEFNMKFSTLKQNIKNKKEFSKEIPTNIKNDRILLANHFGIFASEFNNRMLDDPIAKDIMLFQFMRFGFVFRGKMEGVDVYSNFNKLYDQWLIEIREEAPHN